MRRIGEMSQALMNPISLLYPRNWKPQLRSTHIWSLFTMLFSLPSSTLSVAGSQNGRAEKAMAVEFTTIKSQLMVQAPKVVDALQFYNTAFDTIDNSYTLYPKCKAEQELLHILSVQFELVGFTVLVSDFTGNSALVKSEKTGCVLCIKTKDVEAVIAKVVSARAIVKDGDVCCGGHVGKDKDPYGYSWLICFLAKNVAEVPTLLGSSFLKYF
ncbi:uncharacterized protein At5g48480-like [Durio zibethinus]|uniref:Uncharacterized protein At5g48480-like n=1 Tax=Durio zibethinus TaxID=66656 RepID=A0A6P5YA48_DURZI|nr:uncharacterized protein At5g48480-like [Durio zibethinus]